MSESEFWREIAAADDDAEREIIFASARLRAGATDAIAIIDELKQCSPPGTPISRLLKVSAKAARDGERNENAHRTLYAALQAQTELPDETEEAAAVIMRKMSMARLLYSSLWIYGGLWLLRPPEALAFLLTTRQKLPELATLELPDSEETVADWRNKLGLKQYEGKGRLVYSQHGDPFPDRVLIEELGCAISAEVPSLACLTAYQAGNIFMTSFLRKML